MAKNDTPKSERKAKTPRPPRTPRKPRTPRAPRKSGSGGGGIGIGREAGIATGIAAIVAVGLGAVLAGRRRKDGAPAPAARAVSTGVPAQTGTTAADGPLTGAVAEEAPIDHDLGTPMLAGEPRLYTGAARPDMAIYSEPGNDERPADQPDAARNARDEGEPVGAMVDA